MDYSTSNGAQQTSAVGTEYQIQPTPDYATQPELAQAATLAPEVSAVPQGEVVTGSAPTEQSAAPLMNDIVPPKAMVEAPLPGMAENVASLPVGEAPAAIEQSGVALTLTEGVPGAATPPVVPTVESMPLEAAPVALQPSSISSVPKSHSKPQSTTLLARLLTRPPRESLDKLGSELELLVMAESERA